MSESVGRVEWGWDSYGEVARLREILSRYLTADELRVEGVERFGTIEELFADLDADS